MTQSPCNSHVDAIWLEVTSAWLKFMRMCPQVLTKAALMSYERLHVFEGIVDRDWNPHGSGHKYASKLLCAWQFDKITSGGCSATCASRRHDLLLWPPQSRECTEILLQDWRSCWGNDSLLACSLTGSSSYESQACLNESIKKSSLAI